MKFIEKNFQKFLYNLVKDELSNNKTAKVIATYLKKLNTSSKEKLFESIQSYYNTFSDQQFDNIDFKESSETVSLENKDFRLKSIRIDGCRRFPKANGEVKYGIDFEVGGEPKNQILLGQNASGKSSLFCALEYIFTLHIGEKKLRTGDLKNNSEFAFQKYLSHFDNTPYCKISTVGGDFAINKPLPLAFSDFLKCLPENHFISDYNLYEKGKIDCIGNSNDEFSFHRLIANSLGLQEYLDFTTLLKSLVSYKRLKESNERRKLLNERDSQMENIDLRTKEVAEKKLRKLELEKGAQENHTALETQKTINQIFQLKESKYRIEYDSLSFNSIIEELKTANNLFISLSVTPDLQNEANFLSLGLELLNTHDNCPLCNSSTKRVDEIKTSINERLEVIKDFYRAKQNLDNCVQSAIQFITGLQESIDSISSKLRTEIENNKSYLPLVPVITEDLKKLNSLFGLQSSLRTISSEILLYRSIDDNKLTNVIESLINNQQKISTILNDVTEVVTSIGSQRSLSLPEIEGKLLLSANSRTSSDEIAILASDIIKAESAITNSKNRIAELDRDIARLSNSIDLTNLIKEECAILASLLDNTVNKLTVHSFEVIKGTVTDVLADYLKDDDAFLKIYIKEEPSSDDPDLINKTIVAEIEKIQDGVLKTIPPSIYFNTFRYRLLCLMVCISIVIVVRQQTKVNLPLIMDDIFNSSDYTSKSTFRRFIIKLFNIFRKYNNDMPLQLILFTHDELIFDCAIDAIADYEIQVDELSLISENKYWTSPLREKTVFSRLFSPKEIDEEITESQFGAFKDITYKIPILVQDQLINED